MVRKDPPQPKKGKEKDQDNGPIVELDLAQAQGRIHANMGSSIAQLQFGPRGPNPEDMTALIGMLVGGMGTRVVPAPNFAPGSVVPSPSPGFDQQKARASKWSPPSMDRILQNKKRSDEQKKRQSDSVTSSVGRKKSKMKDLINPNEDMDDGSGVSKISGASSVFSAGGLTSSPTPHNVFDLSMMQQESRSKANSGFQSTIQLRESIYHQLFAYVVGKQTKWISTQFNNLFACTYALLPHLNGTKGKQRIFFWLYGVSMCREIGGRQCCFTSSCSWYKKVC